MKAKSIKGQTPEEIQSALKKCIEDEFFPTLAIVFLSLKQDRDAICNILDKEGIAIYGSTTDGEIIDDEIMKGSIAILLLDINREHFTILFEEIENENFQEVSRTIAKNALESFSNPTFLVSVSGVSTMPYLEQLLPGFEGVIGKDVNVFGGMAGDDMTLTEQFVFTNKKSSNCAVVAVTINADKINIKGRAICGWKPMGLSKTVTKSSGNRVYTIDDISPKELTLKYGGLSEFPIDNPIEQATILNQTLALQLQRDQGDPVMRVVFFDSEDGSFSCMGSMPEGAKVKFCPPPDFDIIDEIGQKFEELREEEIPEADAVILYSCTGRLMTFGPVISKEIELIHRVWEAPLVGFFCNGELARPRGGKLELHNLTVCGVALKEK